MSLARVEDDDDEEEEEEEEDVGGDFLAPPLRASGPLVDSRMAGPCPGGQERDGRERSDSGAPSPSPASVASDVETVGTGLMVWALATVAALAALAGTAVEPVGAVRDRRANRRLRRRLAPAR